MSLVGLLFGFRGRINRAKFWQAVLFFFAISIAYIAGIVWSAGGLSLNDPMRLIDGFFASAPIGVALGLAMTFSGLAVGVKRLHDRAKSGWWMLLFWLGPSVFSGMQATTVSPGMIMAYSLAGLIIAIWSFVELGCLRGTSGANKYGPDPLGGFSNEPLR